MVKITKEIKKGKGMGKDMNNVTAKRNYKDSIFRSLFNDEKELLNLYNALSGKNYPEDTEIEIVTLDDAVFNGQKNDLAFIVNKKFINLTEHQSTLSPNMPLRFLEYIAKEYQKLHYSNAVYSEKQVELPTPEFYVLYNGAKDAPLEQTMKLSDTFMGECDTISLELIVKMINVNYDKGAEILDKCNTLREYSMFMHRIRSLRDEYDDLDLAIDAGIRQCISEGILVEFLKNNRGSIMSFLEVNLTKEECEEIRWKDGYAEGRAEGHAEGHAEAVKELAKKFKVTGTPIDVIAENTGLSIEEIEKL